MKNIILFFLLLVLYSCSDSSTSSSNDPFVRIYYIIPNPVGSDDYHEEFCIRNTSESFFKGFEESYYIKDSDGSKWDLDLDNLMPGQTQVIISPFTAKLLNSADTVYLYNYKKEIVQTVTYKDAKDGDTIWAK